MAGGQAASVKWKERFSNSKKYLEDSLNVGAQNYDKNIANAEAAYEEGTRRAIDEKRYLPSVVGKGSEWKTKMTAKGVNRWEEGGAKGQADYLRGAGATIDAAQSFDYGPRGARGSMAQMERQRNAVAFMRAQRGRR
jgi:hypothetical protein